MNQREKGALLLLLGCFLLTSLNHVQATTVNPSMPVGVVAPDSDYSVYWDETGALYRNKIITPISSDQDMRAGLMFPSVDIPQGAKINNATLSLYFDTYLENATDEVMISLWDYQGGAKPGVTFDQIDPNNLIIQVPVNVNLTDITTAQWVNIDVTKIIQAHVNYYFWEPGDSVIIIIYSAENQGAWRAYQSNVGLRVPQLEITYGINPINNNEFEQYRDYTIIFNQTESIEKLLFYKNNTATYALYYDYSLYYGDTPSWVQLEINGLDTKGYWADQDSFFLNNRTVYGLMKNTTNNVKLWRTHLSTLDQTWEFIGEINTDAISGTALAYNEAENIIYLFALDNVGGEAYFATLEPENGTFIDHGKFYDGYSTGTSNSMSAVYEPSNESIILAFSAPRPSGSANAIRTYQFKNKTKVRLLRQFYDDSEPSYYPHLAIFKDRLYLFMKRFSSEYYTYWNISDLYSNPNSVTLVHIHGNAGNPSGSKGRDHVFNATGAQNTTKLQYTYISPSGNLKYVYFDANYTFYDRTETTAIKPPDETGSFGFINKFPDGTDVINIYGGDHPGIYVVDDVAELVAGADTWSYDTFWSNYEANGVSSPGINTFSKSVFPLSNALVYSIYDENGTLIDVVDNLEEAKEQIDDLLGGADPENPTPPGSDWEEEGAFTRAKMKLYFLIIGLACFWLPLYYLAYAVKGGMKAVFFFAIMVFWMLAFALFWSIPQL